MSPRTCPGPGRARRVEFEYKRHGTLAYFGAYDVHRARLIGRVAPSTGIAPFTALVAQVMTTEPYASAKRVFWIVDNGASHIGQASITRMGAAWPTATLVHLPVHASWLNQIEIVFSVIQRKVIKPADFDDLDAFARRLMRSSRGTTPPRPVRLALHPGRPQRSDPADRDAPAGPFEQAALNHARCGGLKSGQRLRR